MMNRRSFFAMIAGIVAAPIAAPAIRGEIEARKFIGALDLGPKCPWVMPPYGVLIIPDGPFILQPPVFSGNVFLKQSYQRTLSIRDPDGIARLVTINRDA